MSRRASARVGVGAVLFVVAGACAEVHGSTAGIALAALDWLVGAAFAVAAVRTGSERWVALLAAGTWYLGTVAGTAGWLGTIGTAAVLAYRAPVLHLLLRPKHGPLVSAALAGAGYPAVLLSSRVANPMTIALAVACTATLASTVRRLPSDRRSNAAARAVHALVLAAVWAGSTMRWPPELRLVALDVVMIATAAVTASVRHSTLAAATDLLVDLGPARHAPVPVSTVIGRTLGAAQLAVLYRTREGDWLDELALPAPPPPPGTLTAPTPDGGLVALVGCPPELVDSELGRAAARGAALAIADTMALAAVRHRAAEVDASRRRLLDVSDSERRELVERVRAGPVAQLAKVRRLLDRITGVDSAEVGAIFGELDTVTAELDRLAEGLYPASAMRVPVTAQLHALAATLAPPAGVHVAGRVAELPAELRVLVRFVVAECLTNVARYAPGCEAVLDLQVTDGVLVLRIVDHGPGGASVRPGGGLEGLADRAALLGGALRLTSPVGGPTEVRVEVRLPGGDRGQSSCSWWRAAGPQSG